MGNNGGGRKPTPATMLDNKTRKDSNDNLAQRVVIESALVDTDAKLKCPKALSPAAKKEWKRIINLYKKLESRILCDLDVTALAMYCEAVAVYQKAQETWTKYGFVVSSNSQAQNMMDKCLKIMNEQTRIISSLSEQLCLTPVGRARMGLMKQKEDTEDEELDELL